MTQPEALLRECAEKYGDAFTMKLIGIGKVVIVHAPAMVKQVFAADPDHLQAGASAIVLIPLLGRSSVLTLDGPQHRRQRRLLTPAFHGERMRAYTEVMRVAAQRSIAGWPVGEPFSLHARMQTVTLEVILRAVFGIDAASESGRRMASSLTLLLESIASPMLLLPGLLGIDAFRRAPFLTMSRAKRAADAAVFEEIARRRHTGERGEDVLSMLMDACDDAGDRMTDLELRDELMTLLVAGHETSATSLAWTVDLLLHDPASLARLEEELRTTTDLTHAPWLEAVCRESLRLRPVLPLVMRRLTAPFTVGGFDLPAGARVAPSIWLVHRRADLYPDPERFDPSRFLDGTPGPDAWFPFGGANRRCLGAAFAIHEMKVILAEIVRSTRLEAAGPLDLVRRRSITFSPKQGTRILLRTRHP